MDAVDFFCAADDQHRVILLTDLLERAGQTVRLRSEAVAHPTDPCVVACTRRVLREPWIVDLFTSGPDGAGPDVLAIRLDDAPLPGRCARVVDMQSWPARSADRKVGSVVRWLEHARLAKALREVPDDSATAPPRLRRRPGRRRAPRDTRNLASALVILGLVVGTVALLRLAAPDAGSRTVPDAALPEAPAPSPERPDTPRGPDPPPAAGTETPVDPSVAVVPLAGGEGHGPVAARGTDGSPPTASSITDAAGPDGGDSLAHLCNARTVAAAEAWARALDWRQRRRAAVEPCVALLLRRPGYEGIAARLARP